MVLSGDSSQARPITHAGRERGNPYNVNDVIASPPAAVMGFLSSCGCCVEDNGGRQGIYGVTVMAGCNSHTTMRRAEGASRGLLNLVAERIRGTGVAHSLSTLLLGVGGGFAVAVTHFTTSYEDHTRQAC